MSLLHRVPSPFSQLLADESDDGQEQFDAAAVLNWTKEELETNLKTFESKADIVDSMLHTIETFETLSDVEVEADLLNESLWMDGKLFIDESSFSAISPQPRQTQQNPIELESIYNAVNNGAFTPPQTPPYEYQQSAQSTPTQHPCGESVVQPDLDCLVIPLDIDIAAYEPVQQNDVDRELAVVDELVRTRANGFLPASPCSSSTGSESSSSSSSSEDFDWAQDFGKAPKTNRKRAKPYTCMDDKRSRKKEQNKNAATRYRMKKKAEVAEIQGEESSLLQHKVSLEAKIVDLQREIKCLKGLMTDFFKEKGLIR